MSDNIIVLPREDVARFMAAVAELEQRSNFNPDMEEEERDAIDTLSRIASDIDQQVSTQ